MHDLSRSTRYRRVGEELYIVRLSNTSEAKRLLNIALPLILAYLADILMIVTMKIVVGKLGYLELASAGISADISYQMAIILMGFFSVIGVFASEAFGARRKEDALPALLQGLLVATIAGVVLTIVVMRLDVILRLAGQDPQLIEMAKPFYLQFAFSMLPIIWVGALRGFLAALMQTRAVMAIALATVFLNFLLLQALVHGQFGFPELGLEGAGLAWSSAMWYKCICLAGVTIWMIRRYGLHHSRRPWLFAGSGYWAMLKLGAPVAGIVALESGLFAACSLLSGLLGPVSLAAYQVMLGWIAIPFVISLGLAEAAMVRVAYWMGADDQQAARQSGHLGMAIGVAIPLVLIIIPLGVPHLVVRAFLDPADAGYSEISLLVGKLLFIAAIFQVFDGLQSLASHVLRAVRDTAVPLVIAGTGYWIVGLGSAYVMGFILGWGAVGLWWGLALGLIFTGTLLTIRFEMLTRRQLVESPA